MSSYSCNVVVAGSNNQSVSTQLFQNGVAIANVFGKCFIQTNSQSQNNAMTAMVTMNPNDYI